MVALDSTDVSAFPFVYLTGHGLVRFTKAEKENFGRYVQDGGFVFVDDCNHDVTGLFAQSFEREMADLFPGQLRSLPNTHPLYSAAFPLPGRATGHPPRAQRLGRQPRPRAPPGGERRREARPSCTPTRTMAASGTMT